jgi:DNA-3-methyladenine glycosylase
VRAGATDGPLDRALLAASTLDAARSLIGARLVRDATDAVATGVAHERRVGRIVEVEAYIGTEDRASHARFGRTARNAVMFGPPGIAYVYLVYGMHDCLNVVTEPEGRPAAVLIRAVEPIEGIDAILGACAARGVGRRAGPRLTGGPGLVAAGFGITRSDTGTDLLDPRSTLRIERAPAGEPAPALEASPRIGIGYAAEPWRSLPWRFFDPASPTIARRGRPAPPG